MLGPSQKSDSHCSQSQTLEISHDQIAQNERRTLWVVALTATMMVIEVIAGYWTGSMALLADGYHMASHAGALGISYLVYQLAKSPKVKSHLTFGTGKLLPLGGYSSCVGLGIIALWMACESIVRLFSPVQIDFSEAIVIAAVGLAVNVASIFILGGNLRHEDHDHDHDDDHEHPEHVHDHNHRSAVLHVMADALTSVTAIVALVIGKYWGATWLDPVMGVVGSLVILRWAFQRGKVTAKELLDVHTGHHIEVVRQKLLSEGIELIDYHSWKVGPSNLAVQLIVKAPKTQSESFYKDILAVHEHKLHLVVEHQ